MQEKPEQTSCPAVNGTTETHSKNKQYHVSSMEQYRRMYQESVEEPEVFWGRLAKRLSWKISPKLNREDFVRYNFDPTQGPVEVCWMKGAVLNVCYNVLDRHVENGLGTKVAYYWEGNEPEDRRTITYKQLLDDVCRFANVLKRKGVTKGDSVTIYLPMIPELVVAILACARLGAMHTVVFAGYSAESLAQRTTDTKSKVMITADGSWRGKKLIQLKPIAESAIAICKGNGHVVETCIMVRHLKQDLNSNHVNGICLEPRINNDCTLYSWWHNEIEMESPKCDVVWVNAEDPLFLLYTSGSTGKPKGVVHSAGGYLLYAYSTVYFTFNYKPDDVFFCTADVGWITGHTHVVYGVLANGATSVLFEGIPFHPDPGRFWALIDRYQVNKFYTAPTAIRALMRYGDGYVKMYSRQSLELLGTAGEPISPEVWLWYHRIVGNSRCTVLDTFWQTETGGQMITPLPGCTLLKPGSATLPFFGVVPAILDQDGKEMKGPGEGFLAIKSPWPGMMITLYKDHDRFQKSYFSKYPGYYLTGDGARRDEDGYYWVTGRIDDMLNVSGHLISTAQVESAVLAVKDVAEAAAVPQPHHIKGECLYCYVVLKDGAEFSEELQKQVKHSVRSRIGAFADPEHIRCVQRLPKTRSGKVMRRILRQIARNDFDFGDTSTLSEDDVIAELLVSNCIVNSGSHNDH
ncbi:acetyl-coenzyme A synthetase, cytoplasmic-like [Ornithodoros turicata]|uniref:acetyl-coenzyme A synthetase, cytoplasmic-like n=1 Tax=Ornithodoros turicata TaxID=34597 RepID=UPI0031394D46